MKLNCRRVSWRGSSIFFEALLLALAFCLFLGTSASVPAEPPESLEDADRKFSSPDRDNPKNGKKSINPVKGASSLPATSSAPENSPVIENNLGLDILTGEQSSRRVKETMKFGSDTLSAYGTDFELVGKGNTPSVQEATYRFRDGNKRSLIAVDGDIESAEFYTVRKDFSGNRTVKTRENLDYLDKTYFEGNLIGSDGRMSQPIFNFIEDIPGKDPEDASGFLHLSGPVIPDERLNLYEVKHERDDWVYARITSKNNFSFVAMDPAGAEATYDSDFTAPYCSSGLSPCVANSSLLLSRDGMGPGEPNAPNTIDSASDGTSVTNGYEQEESVENITVKSNDNPVLGDGDQVTVWSQVYCYDNSDAINFVHSSSTSSISWNVQNSQTCSGGGGPYNLSTTFTLANSDGPQAIRVVNEYNGGSSTTESTSGYGDQDDLVVEVDGESPQISIFSPSDGSVIQSGELLRFNVSDPEEHLDAVSYTVDGGSSQSLSSPYEIDTSGWSEGSHTVTVTATDLAGHSTSSQYQFEIDDTEPYVEIISPENRLYSTDSLTLDYSSSDTNLAETFYSLNDETNISLSGSTSFTAEEGMNTIKLYANDTAGNLNSTNVDFEVDTVAPDIILDAPPNESEVEKGLYINLSVNDANTDTVQYSLNEEPNSTDFANSYDISTSGWQDGLNNLTIYANDSAGYSSKKFFRFNITSNQPPVIILDQPGNNTPVKGDGLINFTVTDNNLTDVRYSIDGAPNSTGFTGSYDIPLGISSEGNFTLDMYANDTDGGASSKFYIFEADNTPPSLTLYHPENTTYKDSVVDLNYSSSDKNLDKTYYSLNDGENNTLSGNTSISILEGSNTLNLYAEDEAENIRQETVVFSKDTKPPAISVLEPRNQTYYQEDVPAEVSLNEEGNQCVYSLDGGSNTTMTKENETRFSNTMADLNYQQHSIKYWCEDLYNNWASSDVLYFTNKESEALYNPDLGAPFCVGGESPCNVNESLIISKDNLATDEPNSPNTIDGAADGTSGTYQNDESVDAVNITDLSASTFSAGHTVEVSVKAYCYDNTDVVNIAFAENIDSPSWNIQSSTACSASGFEIFTTTFGLTGTGNVSIRSLNEYNGDNTVTATSSGYGDQDDVVIPLDNSPPQIILQSPDDGAIIKNGTEIDLDVSDPKYSNLDTATFVNGSGINYSLSEPYRIDTSGWSEGTRDVTVYANDTAKNYASKSYQFSIDRTPPTGKDLKVKKNGEEVNRVYIGNKYDFTSFWNDNFQLKSAEISSNESGTFENSSLTGPVSLSGTSDYANFSAEIPSTDEKVLGWKVWGEDEAGYLNFTSTDAVGIWRYVNVSWIQPENGEVGQGNSVNLGCKVRENLTGTDVSNYQVKFYVNNSTTTSSVGSDSTNIYGNAFKTWDTTGYAIGNYTTSCNITEDSQQQYEPLIQTDNSTVYVGEGDPKVNQVLTPNRELVEGEEVELAVNISNHGLKGINSGNITVSTATFNGTSWNNKGNISDTYSLGKDSWKWVNLTWSVNSGPWRFNATADPQDKLDERNESDNSNSTELDVSSYQIYYGGNDIIQKLDSDSGQRITAWGAEKNTANIYFSDTDASYSFSDLEPANSSGDLAEIDEAIKLEGHNDSVQESYSLSNTKCFNISSSEICDVPSVNSTNTESFQTGIFYDTGDGNGFDGTQDLIFVANTNTSKDGKYGNYDYEARIPSTLGEQKDGANKIDVFTEIN